ncbi:hypothetical protein CfE428DRAFT_3806 [Chthoniobacter flavus Ellin428]|uniref:Uncharacterized protein n=1 Tax=Chthoniobacter flavus Ellin428 TaxID=497964 RepID=B4D4G8_9BACT|nr:hypothetical protein CfE428DRAFT_3806 [Chthoniobacter flavus Ellin428]
MDDTAVESASSTGGALHATREFGGDEVRDRAHAGTRARVDGGLGDEGLVFGGRDELLHPRGSGIAAAVELVAEHRREQDRDELRLRRLGESATAGEVGGVAAGDALEQGVELHGSPPLVGGRAKGATGVVVVLKKGIARRIRPGWYQAMNVACEITDLALPVGARRGGWPRISVSSRRNPDLTAAQRDLRRKAAG